MTDLTWEEPRRPYAEEILDLRIALSERPNTYARVQEDLNYIEAVRWCDRYRGRGLSASRRLQPDGTYHVYAKWVE